MEVRIRKKNNRSRRSAEEDPFPNQAQAAFQRLIADFEFPCVGAKAALNSGTVSYCFYEELASDVSTRNLARDLEHFTGKVTANRDDRYATMIAVFGGPFDLTEFEFEKLLWLQLNKLHEADAPNFPWDARVSSDPSAPNFSFSFAGQAYYVIGMHANSSRHARRFPWPALVFNPHEQFERLRTDGNWDRMKQTIRTRDFQLQGSINPMLSDFGEQSEARQYSGRAVEENWQPPFAPGQCPFTR